MSASELEPMAEDALCDVIEGVDAVLGAADDSAAWARVSPLVARVSEQARLTDADRAIIAELPHLEVVCHRPRLLLRATEERLPVARVRRLAPRAVTELAARPVDWERRTFSGVEPSRVLAVETDDLWDLYENRVAARLVDHLLRVVTQRLAALRGLGRLLDDEHSYVDDAVGGRHRAERLFQLWGEACSDTDQVVPALKKTKREIERLHMTLLGLLDSPLYRAIPRTAGVDATLVATNVLVNDQHYRHVARLWRRTLAFWRRPSARALLERQRLQRRAFGRFARLVVIRALETLGFRLEPDTRGLAAPVGVCTFERAHDLDAMTADAMRLELRWDESGELALCHGTAALAVVPCLVGLRRLEPETFGAILQGRGAPALFLLSGHPDEVGVARVLLDTHTGASRWPGVAVIAPWTIDSVEQVARALGVWVARHVLPRYPIMRPVRPLPSIRLPDFVREHGNELAVIRPITPVERNEATRLIARERERLVQEERRARNARQPFDKSTLTALESVDALVHDAGALEALLDCPVCGTRCTRFEPRLAAPGMSTWWVTCDECGSEYGTRPCPTRKHVYPVLVLEGLAHAGRAGSEADRSRGWLERTFGKDVWAAPSDRAGGYVCTECGAA